MNRARRLISMLATLRALRDEDPSYELALSVLHDLVPREIVRWGGTSEQCQMELARAREQLRLPS
jgi:hypothetical protein